MRGTFVTVWSGISLGLLAASPPALGADATAGKTFFTQQCSICHSAEPGDTGGAQGPSLIGVYGRHAASAAGFSYTGALRAANLTWDAPTLRRFLASPATVVPGTAMVIAVPNESDRDNLIAYFQNLSRTQSATDAASKGRRDLIALLNSHPNPLECRSPLANFKSHVPDDLDRLACVQTELRRMVHHYLSLWIGYVSNISFGKVYTPSRPLWSHPCP